MSNRALSLCLLLALVPSLPALARVPDEDTDEEEMQKIKAALKEQARLRLERLKAQLSPQPGPADGSSWISRAAQFLPEVSLAGELRLAYDTAAVERSVQTVEVGLGKTLDGLFRLDAFAVFGPQGAALREAYATTLFLPFRLQLRAGLFLHRFGLTNAWHSHAFALWGRPAVTAALFGPDGGGGLGLEGSWLLPLPWPVELAAAVMGAPATPATASATFLPQDLQYIVTLKQFARLSRRGPTLSVGLSAALVPNDTGRSNRTDIYGADLLVRYRRGALGLSLLGEWMYRRQQVPAFVLQDSSGYVEAQLSLFSRLLACARYEYLGGERHRAGLALNYAPSRYVLVQASGFVEPVPSPRYAGFLKLLLLWGPHALQQGPIETER